MTLTSHHLHSLPPSTPQPSHLVSLIIHSNIVSMFTTVLLRLPYEKLMVNNATQFDATAVQKFTLMTVSTGS